MKLGTTLAALTLSLTLSSLTHAELVRDTATVQSILQSECGQKVFASPVHQSYIAMGIRLATVRVEEDSITANYSNQRSVTVSCEATIAESLAELAAE